MSTGVDFIDVKGTLEARFDDVGYNYTRAGIGCMRNAKLVCEYAMRIRFE